MIRVCSVCILRIKFNIDLSFSEMRRLYRIKFINAYYTERESKREREREKQRERERDRERDRERERQRETERERETDRENQDELERVPQMNFENSKLMRQILLVECFR